MVDTLKYHHIMEFFLPIVTIMLRFTTVGFRRLVGWQALMASRLTSIEAGHRATIALTIDGKHREAFEGDTVLTAVLRHLEHVRRHDFGSEPRAGFCAMGACQDCWVWLADGRRLRACSTRLESGMAIVGMAP